MSLELISLVTAVIGLLMTAVSLETNAQSDQQNITKILQPNATLTDLQNFLQYRYLEPPYKDQRLTLPL